MRMSNIIDFPDNHREYEFKCNSCGEQFTASIWDNDYKPDIFIDCSECGEPRATLLYPAGHNYVGSYFVCNCGCSHYLITPDGPMCFNCGYYPDTNELW